MRTVQIFNINLFNEFLYELCLENPLLYEIPKIKDKNIGQFSFYIRNKIIQEIYFSLDKCLKDS